jgi:putative transcriptional regulator
MNDNICMIKNNLSKLMGEKRMKISEVQELTGLHYNTIRRIYYDEHDNIHYKTLDKLCWALNCTTSDILEYIPDENSQTPSVSTKLKTT